MSPSQMVMSWGLDAKGGTAPQVVAILIVNSKDTLGYPSFRQTHFGRCLLKVKETEPNIKQSGWLQMCRNSNLPRVEL